MRFERVDFLNAVGVIFWCNEFRFQQFFFFFLFSADYMNLFIYLFLSWYDDG